MALNNEDKKWIKETIAEAIGENAKLLKAYIDFEIQTVKEKLAHMENLPTKEEFYALADKILTSNKKIELELGSIHAILASHEERIYKLENQNQPAHKLSIK